jgi:hypothetical protein
MRAHVHVAALGNEVGCVEALVAAHGHPSSAPNLLQHQQRL